MNTRANKSLTVEEAAKLALEIPDHYIEGEPYAYEHGQKDGFKAGTEWQKEQGFIKWYSVEKDGVPKYDPVTGILVPLLLHHTDGQRYTTIENGYYHHNGIDGRFEANGGYELKVTHYAYFNYPE